MHRDAFNATTLRAGLAVFVAAILSSAVIAPSSASAGSYVVRECYPPNHTAAPDAVYSTNGALAFTPSGNDCTNEAVGLGIGTIGNGWCCNLVASWALVPPPGATINTVAFLRRANDAGGYNALNSVCSASGTCNAHNLNTGPFFVGHTFGPGGWTSFSSIIQCGTTCNQGGFIYMRNIEFTMQDSAAPTITSLGGDLLAGGERSGVENLTIGAADSGAGVADVQVRVNGGSVASAQNSCEAAIGGAYRQMRPCPNGSFELPINTEIPPWQLGENQLEVCAYDLTGSGAANAACARRTVVVNNSCQGTGGAEGATAIDGAIQRGTGPLAPAVTVRSTEGATVRGQLAGPGGSTSSANVCLYETVDDGSSTKRELTQIGKTKDDGSFAIQVPAGPSRKLDLVYRFNNRAISKPNLRLKAIVVPTLRARPKKVSNRDRVFFSGALPGPNNGGRVVSLQAKAGKKWRTFKTVKTDDKGRYQGLYRFTRTRGRVIYRFRAQVKQQGGYPYERGVSTKRKVLVVG